MMANELQVLSIDTVPVLSVTNYLSKRFQSLSPRISTAEIGCFWLEPFSSGGGGEEDFVSQVFELLQEEGFVDVRVGVADTVVASNAASRLVEPFEWVGVEPGGDATFLATLSLDYLPIGDRLRTLFHGVGIRSIRELQAFSTESIQRRFGSAGLRAWTLAWANDLRGPRTPRETTARELRSTLLEPTTSIDTLLFVMKPSVEHLSTNLKKEHKAAQRLELRFIGEGGEEATLPVGFNESTSDAELLFERITYSVREGGLSAWEGAEIESVVITVTKEVHFTPKQNELWHSASLAPHLSESLTAKVEQILGGHSFVVPILFDSQKPEYQGHWIRRSDAAHGMSTASSINIARNGLLASCTKLLEVPSPLRVRGGGHLPSEIFVSVFSQSRWIRIAAWNGPETLSGGWWDKPYERDYFWALSSEQYVVWVFFDRLDSRWFLQGWLD